MNVLLLALGACLFSSVTLADEHAAHSTTQSNSARKWLARQEQAPHLAVAASFDDHGRLWLARAVGRHLQISHSDDAGENFSSPVTVNQVPELIAADGQSRPQIAVVGQKIYLNWTQVLPEPFAGHIRFAVSNNAGQSFSPPVTVNDNQEAITHRFNAMLADAKNITIAWIDKRDGSGKADYRGAAIYTAQSHDGGQTFTANRKQADHSCECCRLGMASDKDGTALIFWRQIFGRNIRDFALARLDEPLMRATEDGWAIDACPHHGGTLAVDRDAIRHLAWFTGAEKSPGLYYRRIDGKTPSKPMPFGSIDAQASHPAIATQNGNVHLVWREFDGKHTRILGMYSTNQGKAWSAPKELSSTEGAADDPLLIQGRGAIWLVWNTARQGVAVKQVSP